MGRVQGKLIILIAVAMGIIGLRSFNAKETQSLKSVEEYWQETGLKVSDIEDILRTDRCHSSERYFLSCANAVVTLAQRFGKRIDLDDENISIKNEKEHVQESEKLQLASWKNKYKHLNSKISFIALFRKLMKESEAKSKDAFYVGTAINAFLSVFKDPHTYLTPAKYYQEIVSQPDGKSFSLGITLGRNANGLILRKVTPRSIAEEVGLKRGDQILRINSQSVDNVNLQQALDILRSEMSEDVHFFVQRKNEKINFVLKRRIQNNDAITTSIISGKKSLGLLTINRFSQKSCELAKNAIEDLKRSNINGLLVDLRDNPGGLVDEAACIASLFLGPKKMFVLKYLDENRDHDIFYGEEAQVFDQSVAVLINSATASSAELLAGILKDYGRAVIVGERSFGKGSFQEGTIWFKNKRLALFQTQGLFYLPSGRSPQIVGIEPDVPVKSSRIFNDRESDMYMFSLQAQEYTPWARFKQKNISSNLVLEASGLFQD